ncbi:MAG: DUF1330 domain-containing protein [Thermoanaerobaculia bacterium]|jgi:uncharacterized protein (DUF1330 family)
MSAYILVQVDVHDATGFARYREAVLPSITAYGGRFIVRGGSIETLEGTWHPPRLAILEFPDAERARAWWASPEYAEPKALRLATARSEMILVEGV